MTDEHRSPPSPAPEVPGAGEIIAPFSWGTGPKPRTVPTEVVMRAIRSNDYTALLPSPEPAPSAQAVARMPRRPVKILALASTATVLGGITVLALLWLLSN